MSIRVTDGNNVLRQFWDDTIGVRAYTTWDAQGVQTFTRPYTPDENARADMTAATVVTSGNDASIADKISTIDMPAMATLIAAPNATLNAGIAPYAKDMAKAIRRLDRKVARILDATD